MANKVDDSPIVVNLTQDMECSPYYHVGLLDMDREDGKPIETKSMNGVTRKHVYWRPRDPVTEEEMGKTVTSNVKPDNVLEFGPGTLGPRKTIWLLPDGFSELPEAVKRETIGEELASMGMFFQKVHYQNRAIIEGLEIAAEKEPQIMDKIRSLVEDTELDDQLALKRLRQLEEFLEVVDRGSKSKKPDSDSN